MCTLFIFNQNITADRHRYLLEINAYAELEDLIKVNNMAINTLPQGVSNIGLQGSLTSHTGQLQIRLGRPFEGVEWLRRSYEIRSHDVPFNPRESAWAAENAANGVSTLNNFQEGTPTNRVYGTIQLGDGSIVSASRQFRICSNTYWLQQYSLFTWHY